MCTVYVFALYTMKGIGSRRIFLILENPLCTLSIFTAAINRLNRISVEWQWSKTCIKAGGVRVCE